MCTLKAWFRRQKFTEAQLQRAYVKRRRVGWPSTYEAAMLDRFCALAIEAEARKEAARQEALAKKQTSKAPVLAFRPCNGVDLKRRAAGDKDD